jgi:ABC-type antimicrobial peptide transport system permease subunit
VVLEGRTDGERLVPELRRAVNELDSGAALYAVGSLDEHVAAAPAIAIRRTLLVVVSALGVVALVLGIVGLTGVTAATVAERTRELGIRQALGARPGAVVALVMRRAGVMAVAGIGLGLGLFVVVARGVPALLYRVTAVDPATLGFVAGGLGVVVLVASFVPARRAALIDPAVSLRVD